MDFFKRPLAITDIQTTGLDAQIHEIIEIGVVVADHKTLEVVSEWDARIKPTNLKKASKKALDLSGYTERRWLNAENLNEALEEFSEETKGAIFLTDNIFFDWSFLNEAFKTTGVEDLMHYHRIDLFSIAWSRRDRFPGLKHFSLAGLCAYFDISPKDGPRRALEGARTQWKVLRKLIQE